MPAPAGVTVAVKLMACPTKGATTLEVSETVVAVCEICVPVPASRMLCGMTPVPPKITSPLTGPAVLGRKAIDSVQVALAARVMGNAEQVPPGAVVKAPVKAIVATDIEAEPVLDNVTFCAALRMPTTALGKARTGSAAARIRWFSLSEMERFPKPSAATALGELRLTLAGVVSSMP